MEAMEMEPESDDILNPISAVPGSTPEASGREGPPRATHFTMIRSRRLQALYFHYPEKRAQFWINALLDTFLAHNCSLFRILYAVRIHHDHRITSLPESSARGD